jgi:hypothetical protein
MFHLTYDILSAVDDFLIYCPNERLFHLETSVDRTAPAIEFTRKVKNGLLTVKLNEKWGEILYEPSNSQLVRRYHHFDDIRSLTLLLKPILIIDRDDFLSTSDTFDSATSANSEHEYRSDLGKSEIDSSALVS